MKKLIFLLSTGILLFVGCSKDPDMSLEENQIRKLAWDYLTELGSFELSHRWYEAEIDFEGVYAGKSEHIDCIWVMFYTHWGLSPIIVCLDKESWEVLGIPIQLASF